jgi:phosphoribosylformylglycinamidine synthase
VSGNVSLYNETKGEDGSSLAILPTPAIGGVGLLDDWEKSATIGFKTENDEIVLISSSLERRHMGQSMWLREIGGRTGGPPPPVDLNAEKRVGEFIRGAIANRLVNAVHDVSDGGLLIAVAEMAVAGGIGAELMNISTCPETPFWFGEDQDTYVATVHDTTDPQLVDAAQQAGVAYQVLGHVGGDTLEIEDVGTVSLADLRAAHEGFFPKLMGSELTPEF